MNMIIAVTSDETVQVVRGIYLGQLIQVNASCTDLGSEHTSQRWIISSQTGSISVVDVTLGTVQH